MPRELLVNNFLTLRFLAPLAPWGWAVVRVTAGLFLVAHGWFKLSGDMGAFAAGLAKKGVPMPEIAAYLSAGAELVGGALLVLGLLTRLAGFFVAFNMAVAIVTTHLGDAANVGRKGGSAFEYPALLFAVGVGAMLHGGGHCSVDGMIERRTGRMNAAPQRAPAAPPRSFTPRSERARVS